MSLKEKVMRMAAFADKEAIASSLQIPMETVEDILDGKADIQVKTNERYGHIIQVNSSRTAHRQKVIAICRAKGGVGATATAFYLARTISEKISTLLIDLNISEGGSDLTYYLKLPQYPHLGTAKRNIIEGIINIQKDFYAIPPPLNKDELGCFNGEDVKSLILQARQEFDAVVIDLPNRDDDITREAIKCSNTVVFIMGAFRQEILRLIPWSKEFYNKTRYLVISNCMLDESDEREAQELLQVQQSVTIPYDQDLEESLESQVFLPKKSPFVEGVEKLKDTIYEESKAGGIKSWLQRMVR